MTGKELFEAKGIIVPGLNGDFRMAKLKINNLLHFWPSQVTYQCSVPGS
jgi:hypothetical protein